MGHTWGLPPSGTTGDTVEGLSTAVTDQNPGEWVYSLLPSRWAVPPWCRPFHPHVLASLPQLFHLSWYMVEAVPDHFIGLAPMVDGLAIVEPVVQNRADGTFGEWFAAGSTVPLTVQLQGQSPEGI